MKSLNRHNMKHKLLNLVILACALPMISSCEESVEDISRKLSKRILADGRLDKVDSMARAIIRTGFNAGDGYGEVWIRDMNTFIELSCEELDTKIIRENLLTFFQFQGPTGDIVDGFIPIEQAEVSEIGYQYRYSDLNPRFAAHKNTVETDQESALIQAVYKYILITGDLFFLEEEIGGKSVMDRLVWAMEWLMTERYNKDYGLLWGATTADWGDVQPEHEWGTIFDESSHVAIDIYDNAMFVLAIDRFIKMTPTNKHGKWLDVSRDIRKKVREHLWDTKNNKYRPHIYIGGSPFPADFDEDKVFYHGGTTVAIEADMLSKEEIKTSYRKMESNVKKSGAASVGLTLYPPYPEGFFKNPGMGPYSYQNGGDWTWFGARTVSALADNGYYLQAYESLIPMLDRVIANKGFYEWYSVDNKPSGSGTFRGSAGVLATAIKKLKEWAKQNE